MKIENINEAAKLAQRYRNWNELKKDLEDEQKPFDSALVFMLPQEGIGRVRAMLLETVNEKIAETTIQIEALE